MSHFEMDSTNTLQTKSTESPTRSPDGFNTTSAGTFGQDQQDISGDGTAIGGQESAKKVLSRLYAPIDGGSAARHTTRGQAYTTGHSAVGWACSRALGFRPHRAGDRG